jgi:hypothetical protein
MKNEKDFTILTRNLRDYKVDYSELLEVGDYYLDFYLFAHSNVNIGVQKCDSIPLRDAINKVYSTTEVYKRPSAKLVATTDPKLIEEGVPHL